MDFKNLLELAGENSVFAKKKFDRLNAKHSGYDDNVSTSAVAKYLAKQKSLKDQQRAAEEEARRKRVKARLEASIGEKNKKVSAEKEASITKAKQQKLKDEESRKNNYKFKVDERYKQKEKDTNRSTEKAASSEQILKIKKHETSHQIKSQKQHFDKKEQDCQNNKKKTEKKKLQSKNASNSSLSFMDLMKIAKTNSESAGTSKNNKLKRSIDKREEELYDPDRYVKTKVKRKNHDIQSNKADREQRLKESSSKLNYQKEPEKLKKNESLRNDTSKTDKKHVSSKNTNIKNNVPVKRGFVMETISSTKSVIPLNKISNTFKQVKSSGVRGIAAQNRVAVKGADRRKGIKHSAQSMEDEFAKEERALARKRRIFEMRRITGNANIEEELYGEDDYDLDEDDESEDGFIDDSETTGDVSKYIRSIFGYDKRRYEDSDDDDLRNMDSNYSQIEKEEARSSRIARIEDAYERMKEQEEEEEELLREKRRKGKSK